MTKLSYTLGMKVFACFIAVLSGITALFDGIGIFLANGYDFYSSSLAELKKLRRRCPETMRCTYFYALSSGVDKQFRHIHVAEADHFKQFVRLIEREGIDI